MMRCEMGADEKRVREIVRKVIAEARSGVSESELEQFYSDEIMHSFTPLTLSQLASAAGKVSSEVPDPMSVPVYFRSEGYHMQAKTLRYVEPPPESGLKPYFLISL